MNRSLRDEVLRLETIIRNYDKKVKVLEELVRKYESGQLVIFVNFLSMWNNFQLKYVQVFNILTKNLLKHG